MTISPWTKTPFQLLAMCSPPEWSEVLVLLFQMPSVGAYRRHSATTVKSPALDRVEHLRSKSAPLRF